MIFFTGDDACSILSYAAPQDSMSFLRALPAQHTRDCETHALVEPLSVCTICTYP